MDQAEQDEEEPVCHDRRYHSGTAKRLERHEQRQGDVTIARAQSNDLSCSSIPSTKPWP